ncbi:hypothetical protein BX600DRAFT_498527 [Xylariales sp. PMI_506]|nr:hypothetical protein BX600DRAFT_498527 [Xylariales sp. PMI_506]
MGLLSLNYRRPQYVDNDEFKQCDMNDSDLDKEYGSLKSGRSGTSAGVPDALTFDKIVNGGTCPPMTIRDFMNYLIYIEHSAENLQFFLWHRDYVKRFNEAKTSDIALAPEWTQAMEDEAVIKIQKEGVEKLKKEPLEASEAFKGTIFEKSSPEANIENKDPFSTPPQTAFSGDEVSTIFSATHTISYREQAQETFSAVGAKQPFTIQPFREEMNRVIATYLADDGSRQLNMSAREHRATLLALSYTTHPSAFRLLSKSVENTLRKQAHPNFVRWSICNGNPARVFFARALGVGTILLATVGAIVLTLSRAGRGYRALFAIGWVIGISTLIAAYKGMCVVLHGLHHRHIRPWELFIEDGSDADEEAFRRSFDSFGSGNSYEDEPWVIKYEKRNVVRKVFDREVWIREPALRQIQDTIFLQSMLSALLLSGILAAIFVAVPGGDLF